MDQDYESNESNESTKAIIYSTYGALVFGSPLDGLTNNKMLKSITDSNLRNVLSRVDPKTEPEKREQDMRRVDEVLNLEDSEILSFKEKHVSPTYDWVRSDLLHSETLVNSVKDQDHNKARDARLKDLIVSSGPVTYFTRPRDDGYQNFPQTDNEDHVQLNQCSNDYFMVIAQVISMKPSAVHSISSRKASLVAQLVQTYSPSSRYLLYLLPFFDGLCFPMDMLKALPKAFDDFEPHYKSKRSRPPIGIPNEEIAQYRALFTREDLLYRAVKEVQSMFLGYTDEHHTGVYISDELQIHISKEYLIQTQQRYDLFYGLAARAIYHAQVAGIVPMELCMPHIKKFHESRHQSTRSPYTNLISEALAHFFCEAGKFQRDEQNYSESARFMEDANYHYSRSLGRMDARTLATYRLLGIAYFLENNKARAKEVFIDVCELQDKRKGPRARAAIGERWNLAMFYMLENDIENAYDENEIVRGRLACRKDGVLLELHKHSKELHAQILEARRSAWHNPHHGGMRRAAESFRPFVQSTH